MCDSELLLLIFFHIQSYPCLVYVLYYTPLARKRTVGRMQSHIIRLKSFEKSFAGGSFDALYQINNHRKHVKYTMPHSLLHIILFPL